MIVVIILGIVSAAALPVYTQSLTQSRVDGAASLVASALDYARYRAMNTQQQFRVVFNISTEELQVEALGYTNASNIMNTTVGTIVGANVEAATAWSVAPHPVNDVGNVTPQGYIVRFATDQFYKGTDIVTAAFSSLSTVTFSAQGVPDAAGTVTVRLGGLLKTISVAAATGTVSVS